jgi:hypothetical protein
MSKQIELEHSSIDDIINLYKKDIDQTLIIENLKLTPEERLLKMQDFINSMTILKKIYQKNKGK